MSNPSTVYCFDTSAFINPWTKIYQPDMFGSIWEQHIPSLFLLGLIVSSRQVLIEIEKQEDDLCEWCRQYKEVFEEVDAVTAAHVTRIMDAYDALSKRNEADPFVVARALASFPSLTVVTEENGAKPSPKKQNIPFICEQNQIRCINFNAFLRESGWVERTK